jgi:hypothetical protein
MGLTPDKVTALVQLRRVPFRTIAPKVCYPLAHVATAPVLSNELGDTITALARAPRALNAQHLGLASNITEGEICSGHCPVPCCLAASPMATLKSIRNLATYAGTMIIAARLEPPKVISGSEAPARTTSRRGLSFFQGRRP